MAFPKIPKWADAPYAAPVPKAHFAPELEVVLELVVRHSEYVGGLLCRCRFGSLEVHDGIQCVVVKGEIVVLDEYIHGLRAPSMSWRSGW